VVFFSLCALILWPGARAWIIALAVLAATCGVELLQLWHPPWLEAIRATTPGDLVLGSTYATEDFPYYFIGAALAWPVMWGVTWPMRRDTAPEGDERRPSDKG
jgi:hypothetical protein